MALLSPVAFGHAIYRGGWWIAVFIPALSERSSATFAGGYQLWIAGLRQLGSYQCLEMAGIIEWIGRMIGLSAAATWIINACHPIAVRRNRRGP